MYRRPLVALDGTSDGAWVLDHLAPLLEPEAMAFLLHVLPEAPTFPGPRLSDWLRLQEETQEYLQRAPIPGFKGEIRTFVDVGETSERILAVATALKADLLALATHAWSGLPSVGLGSVARHVLRSPGPSVLFVPPSSPPWPSGLKRILLPLEGPGWSVPQVEPILRVAGGTTAEVVLLHVEPDVPDPLQGRRTDANLEIAAHDRNRVYQEAAEHLKSFGIDAKSVVVRGDPVGQILRQSSALDASLIAMMSHERRGLERLLVGSVSERVIRYSERPVLLLRPGPGREVGDMAARQLERGGTPS